MDLPSLSLLRSEVSPSIKHVSAELIKRSSTPAAVYRLELAYEDGPGPRSLVVKRIEAGWPGDPLGHEREVRFYQRLLPRLNFPHPTIYYAGPEPGSPANLVIMEDVAGTHRFPAKEHLWTQFEIESILNTYARLHASGQACLPAVGELSWLLDRHEKRLFETAGDLPAMVEALVNCGIWASMPGFGRLLDRTLREAEILSSHPVILLHNDVYPPNCGLPLSGEKDAILVDWDMASIGLAEMDLAFMFIQPYGSHRRLDRQAALAHYWRRRQELDGRRRSKAELKARQWYADALWALWLVPVAFRMAESPFPPGSSPRLYWDAMFGVLGRRLQKLSHEA
jgi:aminoglycoside phosphotransferase (APT) family kinase protein